MQKCAGTPSILLAAILILILFAPIGCGKSTGPEIEWERTFGGLAGGVVSEASDGGYWVNCGSRILLISDDGWLEFDRPFEAGTAWSMQPTLDGGYICAGQQALVKMRGMDCYENCKEWETEPGKGNVTFIWSVDQTPDGGCIVACHTGYTGQYKTSWCTQSIWLGKTDSMGALQWEKVIAIDGVCDERPASVQATPDGGYVILACYGGSWGVSDTCGLLIKTDGDGEVVWQKTFGGGHLQCIQQAADGGYVMVGMRWGGASADASDLGWLVKASSTGDVEWERTFARGEFHSVRLTLDGGYVMAGSKTTGKYADSPLGSLPWLMKTDPSGEVQWQKTFGCQEQDRWDSVSSVQQTSDGGYIVVALKECDTADYFGAQLWLIKMKSD